MANPNISKHYARILSLWPKDPLRPNVSFQTVLQSRMNKPAADPQAELRNVNALYSLLENRYSKKYPVSPELMRPTSNPTYYDDLLKELEQAPQRSWLATQITKWKGFLRLQ